MNNFDQLFDNLNFENAQISTNTKPVLPEIAIKTVSKKVLDLESKHAIDNLLFDTSAIINMIWNEIYSINQKYDYINITPIDNNLFDLKICFDSNKLILSIKLPTRLYPYAPPKVSILFPYYKDSLNYRISNTSYFKLSNWNPTNTIEYTIVSIKNIIDKNGVIAHNNTNELELLLDQLSLITDIVPNVCNTEPLEIEYQEIDKNVNPKSSGVGYGYGIGNGVGYGSNKHKSTDWNIKEYILNNNTKVNYTHLSDLLLKIFMFINIDNFKLVENSCLINLIINQLNNFKICDDVEQVKFYYSLMEIVRTVYKFDNNNKLLNTTLIKFYNLLQHYIKMYEKHTDVKLEQLKKIYNYFDITQVKESVNENSYETILGKYQIDEFELFNKKLLSKDSLGYCQFTLNSANVKHILKEIHNLHNSLPLNEQSSIFIKYDSTKLGIFKFIITGPADTPYDSGCFLFEMIINKDYPNLPPSVKLLTTGHGSVRFNPNLYNEGKVCLSLLGTWSGTQGESWIPGVSTMLQVMVSIQSLILIDNPYYNEPGFESMMGNISNDNASIKYNKNIRMQTITWAIIDMIDKPPIEFKDVIINHFKLKKNYILNKAKEWGIEEKQYKLLVETFNKL